MPASALLYDPALRDASSPHGGSASLGLGPGGGGPEQLSSRPGVGGGMRGGPGGMAHGNGTLPHQQYQQQLHHPQHAALLVERSALARLRADEATTERRKQNAASFGATWLKPPGVAKTLHQLREERREQEEHAEALRREMLAQELAEAAEAQALEAARRLQEEEMAAAGLAVPGDGDGGIGGGEMAIDDGGGERDLDDEIPEAEDFGLDDDDDDDEGDDDDNDDDEEVEIEEVEDEDDPTATATGQQRRSTPGPSHRSARDDDQVSAVRQLVAARMRMADDAFREAAARGDADGSGLYGDEDGDIDNVPTAGGGGAGSGLPGFDEVGSVRGSAGGVGGGPQLLEEDDLVRSHTQGTRHRSRPHGNVVSSEADYHGVEGSSIDMGMEADLDADVPDADELEGISGYEHTDSEAEVSSMMDDGGADDDLPAVSFQQPHDHSQRGFRPQYQQQQHRGGNMDNNASSRDAAGGGRRSGAFTTPPARGQASASHHQQHRTRHVGESDERRRRSNDPRHSLDISSILSPGGSSLMDSSPIARAGGRSARQ